ncbi:RNA-binding protein [Takifugu flavidus]|uniref:RNA-binding protein n=1 Tax=Takifugu flavidus TaxID=433684 RepID=A0A5C6P9R9_9TELE|nr:RNA-binding protein [Takifugu flavidus]
MHTASLTRVAHARILATTRGRSTDGRLQQKMVTRTKKIFVGGLSANTVVEDVKQYFEQFGKQFLPAAHMTSTPS